MARQAGRRPFCPAFWVESRAVLPARVVQSGMYPFPGPTEWPCSLIGECSLPSASPRALGTAEAAPTGLAAAPAGSLLPEPGCLYPSCWSASPRSPREHFINNKTETDRGWRAGKILRAFLVCRPLAGVFACSWSQGGPPVRAGGLGGPRPSLVGKQTCALLPASLFPPVASPEAWPSCLLREPDGA